MEEQNKTSQAAMVAVIGALATVIVGVIPVVISIIRDVEPAPPTTSEATTQVQPSAPAAPVVGAPAAPVAIGDDQVLDQLAISCHDGDFDACDQLYKVSALGSEYEWYGGTCGGILDEISQDTCRSLVEELYYLEDLAGLCAGGDLVACDDLYLQSPLGSEWELYGATCGYRLNEEVDGYCAEAAL